MLDKTFEKVIDLFLEPIVKTIIDQTKEEFANFQVNMGKCFQEYLIRNYDKYSKVKTLFYPTHPVPLEKFYVRTRLERPKQTDYYEKEIIEESDFCTELIEKHRVVVSGTAGSGKSTFCKSVFLELIKQPQGIFPIFIELRNINNEQNQSLFEHIFSKIFYINEDFTKNQLKYAIKTGKILLILDGYDEINYDLRDKYQKEILELSDYNHNIFILLSSRLDNVFQSWNEFAEYHIQPLSKQNAIELITRIDYDREVKKKFLLALEKELFETHKSFAEIPLLLTIMFLTYKEYAEIPNKIHLFYQYAFTTLFQRHDAAKNQFKRKLYTSLDSEQFQKVFSVFCYLTYIREIYSFDEIVFKNFIEKALQYYQLNTVKSEFYIKDLVQHICLIYQDGLNYTFTHRSFQEYFTAYFIAFYIKKDKIFKACEQIFNTNFHNNNLFRMIFDLNKEVLENYWLSSKLQNYILNINEIQKLPNPEKEINTINIVIYNIGYQYIEYKDPRNIFPKEFYIDIDSFLLNNKNEQFWDLMYIIFNYKNFNYRFLYAFSSNIISLLLENNSKSIELKLESITGKEKQYAGNLNFDYLSQADFDILTQSKFYKFIILLLEKRKQFALKKLKEIENNQKLADKILDEDF